MKRVRLAIFCMILLCSLFGCGKEKDNPQEVDSPLEIKEHSELTVTGTLKERPYEINAENKGVAYILQLKEPMAGELLAEDAEATGKQEEIENVQIGSFADGTEIRLWLEQEIAVRGTVMFASTGHHLEKIVLMDCVKVEEGTETEKTEEPQPEQKQPEQKQAETKPSEKPKDTIPDTTPEKPNKTESPFEEIVVALQKAAVFQNDWCYEMTYLNRDDKIIGPDGFSYSAVNKAGINSINSWRASAREYYTDAAVTEMEGLWPWIEQNGKLYISTAMMGRGENFIRRTFVSENIKEEGAQVEVILRDDNSAIGLRDAYTVSCIYENGNWKFNSPITLPTETPPFASYEAAIGTRDSRGQTIG